MYVPRRYVVENTVDNETFLQFGFGSETDIENKSFPDPTDAALELNGRQLYDDATLEIDKIMERMTWDYETLPLDMIG